MENIKKFFQLLMKHTQNKYIMICAILIVGIAQSSYNQGVFITYIIVHSIILQRTYIRYLEDKKRLEGGIFKESLQELIKDVLIEIKQIKAEVDITVNRFINLK